MKYEEPKMELVVLNSTDIIVTSVGDDGDWDFFSKSFQCI